MRNMEKFEKIRQFITNIDSIILNQNSTNIEKLAQTVHLSKYHFIRLFTEFTGITPIQFLHMRILNDAKKNLRINKTLLDNTLDLGLSSSSRLYDIFIKSCAVSPDQYKHFGYQTKITYGIGQSPFGRTLMGITNKGICFLSFLEFVDEYHMNIEGYWKNADLIEDKIIIQEHLDRLFTEKNKINNNNKLNLWNAIFNLPFDNDIEYFWAKNNHLHNEILSVAPCFPFCYETVMQSGAICNYRWGALPLKKVFLYQPIKFSLGLN